MTPDKSIPPSKEKSGGNGKGQSTNDKAHQERLKRTRDDFIRRIREENERRKNQKKSPPSMGPYITGP